MYLGDLYSGIFLEVLALFNLLTLLLNWLNFVHWSISYLFLLITGAIFYFDSHSGFESGSYLFYFPLMFAIAHVFDYRSAQDRLKMLMHTSLVIALPVIHLSTGHNLFRSKYLSDAQRSEMFIFNLTFSIACMGYFGYLIVKANMERLNLLEMVLTEENKLRRMEEEKNKEKEILLAEIQHRVQNNLSLMTSLLRIKQESINSENYGATFTEIFHALQSVAHAHRLQQFKDGRLMVPLQDYLHEIDKHWKELHENQSVPSLIEWKCCGDKLNIKQCITLGLVFHECIVAFSQQIQTLQIPGKLLFDVCEVGPLIRIEVSSTIHNLLAGSKDDLLLYALLEQLDAELLQPVPELYEIRFRVVIPDDYLESRRLFSN